MFSKAQCLGKEEDEKKIKKESCCEMKEIWFSENPVTSQRAGHDSLLNSEPWIKNQDFSGHYEFHGPLSLVSMNQSPCLKNNLKKRKCLNSFTFEVLFFFLNYTKSRKSGTLCLLWSWSDYSPGDGKIQSESGSPGNPENPRAPGESHILGDNKPADCH